MLDGATPRPLTPVFGQRLPRRTSATIARGGYSARARSHTGIPDSRLGIPAGKFLAQMYAAGARGAFDAVGANSYAITADGVFENLRALRRQMNRNGDGAGIWVTEIGWGTTATRAPFDPGPAWQRALIGQTIPLLAQKARSLRLRGVVYYAWRDLPVYAGGRDFWGLHTGLVNKDGSPKPVLSLFGDIVRKIVR